MCAPGDSANACYYYLLCAGLLKSEMIMMIERAKALRKLFVIHAVKLEKKICIHT